VFWLRTEKKLPGIWKVGVNRLNKEISDSNPSSNLSVHWGRFYESVEVPQALFFCKQAIILYVKELSLFKYYHIIVRRFCSKRLASNNLKLILYIQIVTEVGLNIRNSIFSSRINKQDVRICLGIASWWDRDFSCPSHRPQGSLSLLYFIRFPSGG